MPYKSYNFPDQVRGDDWVFEVTLQDSLGGVFDASTNEYWLTLKRDIDDSDPGDIQIGPVLGTAQGIVTLETPGSTTTTLEPGTYSYDIQEVTPASKVTTVLLGKVKVIKDVTRSADYSGTGNIVQTSISGTAVYYGSTSSSTPQQIYFKNTLNGTLGLTENSSMAFSALISGKDTLTNESCAFQINGIAERDASTSRIIGTPGKFILGRENDLFDVNIEVDDTTDTIQVLVTAASTNPTVWSGRIDYTEVYYE